VTPFNTRALEPSTRRGSRIGLWLTIFLLVAVAAALTWRGFDFYRLDLGARAAHKEYRILGPAGRLGHGYGVVATVIIFANLLYLLRRRFAKYIPDSLGTMRTWLVAHAFTGLLGGLLVVFHSAFQLRTAISAVTAISLAVVVVTGIIGYYLYLLVPRADLTPLNTRLTELEPHLPGMVAEVRAYVASIPVSRLPADATLFRTLLTVPRWIREARARRRGMDAAVRRDRLTRAVALQEPALVRAFVAELAELAAAEVDTHAGTAVMRSWRSTHRFLALLMIVTVTLHVGIAWYYGFRWVFE
jgi:hypothetical protein